MFKTFIYGTPKGFMLNEDNSGKKDYFLQFYLPRQGKRLMINRNNNGETTYNYLTYGLSDNGGRPDTAFFGMSILLENNKYCKDLSTIYTRFEQLYDIILSRGNLLKRHSNGIIQYASPSFAECSSEVNWLKSILQNIFSNLEIGEYDDSFTNSDKNKIATFGISEKPTNIQNGFKSYQWICLSSEIKPRSGQQTGSFNLELSYKDMLNQLNEFNERCIKISIDTSSNNKSQLEDLLTKCDEAIFDIRKFNHSLPNNSEEHRKEKERWSDLMKKYEDIKKFAENKLTEISTTRPTTRNERQNSNTNTQNNFQNTNLTNNQGREQDSKDGSTPRLKETRHCKKCNKEKNISDFNANEYICKECKANKKPLLIATIAITLSILGVVLFITLNTDKEENEISTTQTTTNTENTFTDVDFRDLISNKKYTEAREYINSSKDNTELIDNESYRKLIITTLKSIHLDDIYAEDLFYILDIIEKNNPDCKDYLLRLKSVYTDLQNDNNSQILEELKTSEYYSQYQELINYLENNINPNEEVINTPPQQPETEPKTEQETEQKNSTATKNNNTTDSNNDRNQNSSNTDFEIYTINKGETLTEIARKKGTSVDDIMKLNPDIDPHKINKGQTIKIPKK